MLATYFGTIPDVVWFGFAAIRTAPATEYTVSAGRPRRGRQAPAADEKVTDGRC